jgi:nucleolar protein 4
MLMGLPQSTTAKNPFSAPSLLVPDPSSSLARNLVLHGRTLDVVRAVTRETADKLRDAGVKMREKADKRNLYLMREGGKSLSLLAMIIAKLSQ